MDERDKPVDDALGALYRGLPQEAPPPAIDAAILEAAKRGVAVRPARRWAVPVSLAAVLVLSVTVTLRVADERPGIETAPVPPPVAEAPVASVLPQKRDAKPSGPEPALAAQPAARPAPVIVPVPAPAPESAPAPAPAPFASAERSAAPAAGFATAERAKRSMEAQNLALPAAQLPEAWLESIARLRAQARHNEADESFAEFRKRYPEYAIPPEMQLRIAPSR